MVRAAAGGVDESAGDARDEQLVGDGELDDGVKLLLACSKHGIELLRLGNGAGEAVKDETTRKNVSDWFNIIVIKEIYVEFAEEVVFCRKLHDIVYKMTKRLA